MKTIGMRTTKRFKALLDAGWIIADCSCRCGGKYTWMKPRPSGAFETAGCICHTEPNIEEKPMSKGYNLKLTPASEIKFVHVPSKSEEDLEEEIRSALEERFKGKPIHEGMKDEIVGMISPIIDSFYAKTGVEHDQTVSLCKESGSLNVSVDPKSKTVLLDGSYFRKPGPQTDECDHRFIVPVWTLAGDEASCVIKCNSCNEHLTKVVTPSEFDHVYCVSFLPEDWVVDINLPHQMPLSWSLTKQIEKEPMTEKKFFHEAVFVMEPGDIFEPDDSDMCDFVLGDDTLFYNKQSGKSISLRQAHFNLEGKIVKAEPEPVSADSWLYNTFGDTTNFGRNNMKFSFHQGEDNRDILYQPLMEELEVMSGNRFPENITGVVDAFNKIKKELKK